MPWETIGDCGGGTLPLEREQVLAELRLGIAFLEAYVGPPPAGCRLDVLWREFEPSYPTIGLHWEPNQVSGDEVWGYVSHCGDALGLLHQAVDWGALAQLLYPARSAATDGDEWRGE